MFGDQIPPPDPSAPAPWPHNTRKTSVEKLEAARLLANEMIRVAAREPAQCTHEAAIVWAERLHRVLDGDF